MERDNKNGNNQYMYGYVELEEVVKNPEEYIIPQCLPACEVLWNKNIETFMVSNNDDDHLYILLFNISEENKMLLDQLIQKNSKYFFDDYKKAYGFKADGIDDNSVKELISLASQLRPQDTLRYQSSKQFLESFKRTNGKLTIDDYGYIIIQENPELANITFEEALKMSGKEQLYIKEEDRVYESAMYLNWHKRFLSMVSSSNDDFIKKLDVR